MFPPLPLRRYGGYALRPMQVHGHDIGVCSWSVRPKGMADLIQKLHALELEHVHLSLGPLLALDDRERRAELKLLKDSGIHLTAAMISFPGEDFTSIATIRKTAGLVPAAYWDERKTLALRAGALAVELGVSGISLHAGFVPQSNDPLYAPVLERVCAIAEPISAAGVSVLLETGQETANDLLQFLNDLRCQNVCANYDPANFIIYGVGDPIESISILGRHVRHVHLKDAILSDAPGTKWGKEVPLGSGQIPLLQFIEAVDDVGYTGPLVIEAEYSPELDALRDSLKLLQTL